MGDDTVVHLLGINLCEQAGQQQQHDLADTTHTAAELRKEEEVPVAGLVFETEQEVREFYEHYASKQGFNVVTVGGAYSESKKKGKVKRSVSLKCECYGKPTLNSSGVRTVKSKKVDCGARLYAKLRDDGKWVVEIVVLEHNNHTPTPPTGIPRRPMKRFRLESTWSVPVSPKRMCNVVDKERRLKLNDGDANALNRFFHRMKEENGDFYHDFRFFDDCSLRDVLWIDARSIAAYEEFGDVVCFDSTYLINGYDLPLATFVGVNHHGQYVLLGCALLSTEDKETYEWVFSSWLRCMGGRAPKGILTTDQCKFMREAILKVLPDTKHGWCVWHILEKLPKKLGKNCNYDDIARELKDAVYDSLAAEEFVSRWEDLIKTHCLQGSEWLCSMFNDRNMWVPVYMRNYFWAGMETTQRVESIHCFFDGYVNKHTQLAEFLEKYCAALEKMVHDEKELDARDSRWQRSCYTFFELESVFSNIYTDEKFSEVQKQFRKFCHLNVLLDQQRMSGNCTEYMVQDRVWKYKHVPQRRLEEYSTSERRNYRVVFNQETKEVDCECKEFETHGIMCRHQLKVLDYKYILEVPDKYIMRRWRKDVVRKHTKVKVDYHDPTKTEEVLRGEQMYLAFASLAEEAKDSEEKFKLVMECLTLLKVRFAAMDGRRCRSSEGECGIGVGVGLPSPVSAAGTGAGTTEATTFGGILSVAPEGFSSNCQWTRAYGCCKH